MQSFAGLASSTSPTLATVEAIAKAFGLEAWQLLLPDLPADSLLDERVSRSITAYLAADSSERKALDNVLELIRSRHPRRS